MRTRLRRHRGGSFPGPALSHPSSNSPNSQITTEIRLDHPRRRAERGYCRRPGLPSASAHI
ncbi:hypothetical protein OF83DRAFT_1094120 [Amylostereum chailletii]|nr:hypothetical protein OF83DRAFT_1094120 [Amylostereum chailletii]